jgi:hypothetical protein
VSFDEVTASRTNKQGSRDEKFRYELDLKRIKNIVITAYLGNAHSQASVENAR